MLHVLAPTALPRPSLMPIVIFIINKRKPALKLFGLFFVVVVVVIYLFIFLLLFLLVGG